MRKTPSLSLVIPATLALAAATQLLLLRGLIRRMESLESRMQASMQPAVIPTRIQPGDHLEEIPLVRTDGQPASTSGPLLLVLVSPECSACHERVPSLKDATSGPVLIVVVGQGEAAGEFAQELAPLPTVIAEIGDPLVEAVGVQAFPAFLDVDETGTITSIGYDLPPRH